MFVGVGKQAYLLLECEHSQSYLQSFAVQQNTNDYNSYENQIYKK